MAKKRDLKKLIEQICNDLFAECAAASLYGASTSAENISAVLTSIAHMQENYVTRISHLEPGMKAKAYYNNLIKNFKKDVEEVLDQIDNSH